MIHIKNLSKYFSSWDSKVEIFDHLNLFLKPWDFISLVWPSGSGKSTFLHMLGWIDRDFEWEIWLDGKNISQLNENEMTLFRWKNISYIFQNFKLIENLTVKENIDLIIEMNTLERNFKTDEILQIVWLKNKANTYPFHLSGWESQRVAIARAFVGKTQLLLADEPTGALDEKNKKNIMDLIAMLHQKIQNTIILITHDDEVAKMADKIYKITGNGMELQPK